MDDLLDNQINSASQYSFEEVFQFWERRRLTYNVVILFLQMIMLMIVWNELRILGVVFVVKSLVSFNLMANCAYCISWGGEFLLKHYFKLGLGTAAQRKIVFVLGCLFSAVIIFVSFLIVFDSYTI